MKIFYSFLSLFIFSFLTLCAQDTFSIVAVDSATGEVGSAGASCLGYTLPVVPHGAYIISDVIPGKGAIHTQAYWDSTNQQTAHDLMVAGKTPAEIIDGLTSSGDSLIRQYGIVDLNGGHPRTAAFTGNACDDYKSHITGKYYSIQGNTLLGQKVLDSMQSRFLKTKGSLSDRLMAALQGAKMIGADTRCNIHGTSTLSAFIRVAKPTDKTGNLYIDLYMSYANNVSGILKVDPIDSLQHMYSRKRLGINTTEDVALPSVRLFYDQNNMPVFDFSSYPQLNNIEIELYDISGKILYRKPLNSSVFPLFENENPAKGIYLYRILKGGKEAGRGKIAN